MARLSYISGPYDVPTEQQSALNDLLRTDQAMFYKLVALAVYLRAKLTAAGNSVHNLSAEDQDAFYNYKAYRDRYNQRQDAITTNTADWSQGYNDAWTPYVENQASIGIAPLIIAGIVIVVIAALATAGWALTEITRLNNESKGDQQNIDKFLAYAEAHPDTAANVFPLLKQTLATTQQPSTGFGDVIEILKWGGIAYVTLEVIKLFKDKKSASV